MLLLLRCVVLSRGIWSFSLLHFTVSIYRAFLEFMKSSKPELFEDKKKEASSEPSQYFGSDFDQRAMEPQEAILHWDAARPKAKKVSVYVYVSVNKYNTMMLIAK